MQGIQSNVINLEKYINNILNNRLIKENNRVIEVIELLRERVKKNEFRLAVVGEFSSGKSTFINALIGKDILNHATVETTAIVTYIHNVKEDDSLQGKCKVSFINGEIKILDDYANIKEYTTTMSEKEDVVNSIERVDLYLNFFQCDEELVIVDTPGLNGIADKHREITIEEIQRSDACIYLFQKNGITDSDKEFIKLLCNYQNRFIFVQNFIDELRKSEGESAEEKIDSIKSYIVKNIFEANNFKIKYDVFGISALKALTAKDRGIEYLYEGDLSKISNERRNNLLIESNIKAIESNIKTILEQKENIVIKHKAAIHALTNLLEDVLRREIEIQDVNYILLKNSRLYMDKEKSKEALSNLSKKEEEIIKKLDNLVIDNFGKSQKLLKKDIESNIEKILEEISDLIDKENDYEIFESKYENKHFTNELQKLIDNYRNELQESEYTIIQHIYRTMLTRLNEYSNCSTQEIKSLDNIKFVQTPRKEVDFTFKEKNNEINFLKNELNKHEIIKEEENERIQQLTIEDQRNDLEEESKKDTLKSLGNKKRIEEMNLGTRPKRELVGYVEEVSYVDRGGTGFLQAILGPKKVTKQVPRYSDSKGIEWDKKKRQLKEKYYNEEIRLRREIQNINKRKNQLVESMEKSKSAYERSSTQIEYLRRQIKTKEDELKIYITRAKNEYLMLRKSHLKTDIKKYLLKDDSIKEILTRKMIIDMNKNKESIRKEVKIEANRYIRSEIERLKSIINGNQEEINKKYKINEESINELNKIYLELKGVL